MRCLLYVVTTVFMLMSMLQCTFMQGTLVLTSEPSPMGASFCRGPVLFTCQGINIPLAINWQLNGSDISVYSFDRDHTYPRNVEVTPVPGSMVTVTVDNAELSGVGTSINITIILKVSDIAALDGSSLRCEDAALGMASNSINITLNNLPAPPQPFPDCSLTSLEDPTVTLTWSRAFNQEHVVQNYAVNVTAASLIIFSNQTVPPNANLNFNGLILGRNYSITFSALNCGNQEGDLNELSFRLLAPDEPQTVSVVDAENNELRVEWTRVVPPLLSLNCSFSTKISYSVIVENSSGGTMELQTLPNCSNELCFGTFFSSDQYCRVGVIARNDFGDSTTSYAIRNTCDPAEQASRSGLLAIAVVLPVLVIIVVIIVVLYGVVFKYRRKSHRNDTILLTSTSANMPSPSSETSIQQHQSTDYVKDKMAQYTMKELIEKRGDSGVVKELEDEELIQEFAKVGETRSQGISRAKENRFQAYNPIISGSEYSVPSQPNKVNSTTSAEVQAPVEGYSQLPGNDSGGVYSKPYQDGVSRSSALPTDKERIYDSLNKFPCTSMCRYSKDLQQIEGSQKLLSHAGYWLLEHARWSEDELSSTTPLRFCLLKSSQSDWKYKENVIDANLIERILQRSWKKCFVSECEQKSQIRVCFKVDECNWSYVGSLAKSVSKGVPTMVLNFSGMNDREIKATIIHQFGHALGLGHALMNSDQWNSVDKHFRVDQMKKDFGLDGATNFDIIWTGKKLKSDEVNYDESSVMRSIINKAWLKQDVPLDTLESLKIREAAQSVQLSFKDDITREDLLRVDSGFMKKDLKALRTNTGVFYLTKKLAHAWSDIGEKIGIDEKKMSSLSRSIQFKTEIQKLEYIWNLWFNEPSYQETYFLSVEGLVNLLQDIGEEGTASQYLKLYKAAKGL